jgi:hypothetical protein
LLNVVPEPAWDITYPPTCYGLMGEKLKASAALARLAEASRSLDWALGISREPYRDPTFRARLNEGTRKPNGIKPKASMHGELGQP